MGRFEGMDTDFDVSQLDLIACNVVFPFPLLYMRVGLEDGSCGTATDRRACEATMIARTEEQLPVSRLAADNTPSNVFL